MNVADHFGLRQSEQVAVVYKAFLSVFKSLATNVGLGHPIGADRRPHRSINDGDAVFENFFERMMFTLFHVLSPSWKCRCAPEPNRRKYCHALRHCSLEDLPPGGVHSRTRCPTYLTRGAAWVSMSAT